MAQFLGLNSLDIYIYSMMKIVPEYKKQKIPKAVREQLWLRDVGKKYETKCLTPWCHNCVTVFDFHAGHQIPESKGGPTTLDNMVVICSRCNLSMASTYTFTEWSNTFEGKPKKGWKRFLCFTATVNCQN